MRERMQSHLTVDYDEVTKAYNESLTTVLRGFRPAVELLETWVPDEDHARSILNLIEAAESAGLDTISVYIGPDTLRMLNLASLKELAGRCGKVHTEASGEGTSLHVSFADTEADVLSGEPHSKPAVNNQPQSTTRRRNGQPRPWKAPSRQAPTCSGKRTVHPVYRDGLRKASQLCPHEGALAQEPGLELLQAAHQGTTLMALVEPCQHAVKKAAFHGALSDTERGLCEVLCRFMEGKPMLECADHGVIYVEHALRDHSQPPPVAGIMTPESADFVFNLPTLLVRDLLAQYRRRTGFEDTTNFYDSRPKAEWLALSESERLKQIQTAIDGHPLGEGLQVVGTQGPKRVRVKFQGQPQNGTNAGSRLMQLEAYIQATVEPALELEMAPEADQNRIRRIKEAGRP
jgi:hypothetical protein